MVPVVESVSAASVGKVKASDGPNQSIGCLVLVDVGSSTKRATEEASLVYEGDCEGGCIVVAGYADGVNDIGVMPSC